MTADPPGSQPALNGHHARTETRPQHAGTAVPHWNKPLDPVDWKHAEQA
jgi:hypothetical protein